MHLDNKRLASLQLKSAKKYKLYLQPMVLYLYSKTIDAHGSYVRLWVTYLVTQYFVRNSIIIGDVSVRCCLFKKLEIRKN